MRTHLPTLQQLVVLLPVSLLQRCCELLLLWVLLKWVLLLLPGLCWIRPNCL
jgi:hypothetical protein